MYAENGGHLRAELSTLLRQHRVQQRLGGAGSHTIPETTTADERRQLGEQIAVDGSYSYIDSTEQGSDGERDELRRPNHLASLTLDWQASDALQLNINLQHSGSQIDQHFYSEGYDYFSPYVTLDAFTLLAINVNYAATDQLTVYAKATNAGGVHYEEVFGFSTPSRQLAVGVRYQWAK